MSNDQGTSLALAVKNGDRAALARAITLTESNLASDRYEAEQLLSQLLPLVGNSLRIGVTGIPGAGKSTLIESLGIKALQNGYKVAVLTIDPSSASSGGSILGDKTRMSLLSTHPGAFVRPSPSGRTRGGISARTRECIFLCEAAGFDLVIVETIGVGQVEIAVSEMIDILVLLLLPGAGDELQGMKRGTIDLADLVLINKADGSLRDLAHVTVGDYRQALRLVRRPEQDKKVEVLGVSAAKDEGISDVLMKLIRMHEDMRESGALDKRRGVQLKTWFWNEIRQTLIESVGGLERDEDQIIELEGKVILGQMTGSLAARKFINERVGTHLGD